MPAPVGLSYRRMLVDAELQRLASEFGGVILEIGAKRMARGRWRPPLDRVRRWVQLNLEPGERPDVVGDAQALPLRDACVEWVVCVEVLQYVVSPEAAMREIARVLVSGGAAVLAVPFFHRADGPTDRHRFTEVRARELVEGAGLRTLTLAAQGRFFATLANQLRQAAAQVRSRPIRWLVGAGLVPLATLLIALDRLGPVRRSPFLSSFATGFVALARKA
jgi:SAM-dependent methyltransferase